MVGIKSQRVSGEIFINHYETSRPVDWDALFGRRAPLAIEIGFGLGEFLSRLALRHPEQNVVGIEQDWIRIRKAMNRIAVLNQAQGLSNIRVLQVDAWVALERLFVPSSVQSVYCLFPCPWPKKGHIKHRLFSTEFLWLLNSRLVEGGEVQIVTDFQPFFEWVLEQDRDAGFIRQGRVVRPQFDTKYERKWCAAGQKEFYELRLIKRGHVDVPLKEDVEMKVYFVDHFEPSRFQLADTTGETTVIFKEFIFDQERQKGMLHLIAAEEHNTQHVWIVIARCERGWCVAKAEGHTVLPTKAVAQAIFLAAEAVKQTTAS